MELLILSKCTSSVYSPLAGGWFGENCENSYKEFINYFVWSQPQPSSAT